jgi:hypothetical protein
MAENPEVRKCQVWTERRGGHMYKVIVDEKVFGRLPKSAHGSCPDEHEVEAHGDFSIPGTFFEVGYDFDVQKIDWWPS